MDDFERIYRKMEIREHSGLDSDKELTEALAVLCGGEDGIADFDPIKAELEARERFVKNEKVIPRAEPEENIFLCLDMLEKLVDQLKDNLKHPDIKEAVSTCVALEPRLKSVCDFLYWELNTARKFIIDNDGWVTEKEDAILARYAELSWNTVSYEDAFRYYESYIEAVMTMIPIILNRNIKLKVCPEAVWGTLSLMESKSDEMILQEEERKAGPV